MGMHAQSARAQAAAKTPAIGAERSVTAASKEAQGLELARAQMRGHSVNVAADPAAVPPAQGRGAERARVAQVRHLQRTHGNRAVERWLRETRTEETKAPQDKHDSVERSVSASEPSADAPPPPPIPLSPSSSSSAGNAASTAVQREVANDTPWWKAVSFGESLAWQMADHFAPQLTPILRKGPEGLLDWLKDRAAAAAGAAFDSLMSPVHAIAGIGSTLSAQFTPMLGALQDAAAKIAANDCSPISQAADKIEKTAESIITPVIAKLQPVVKKVQDVLSAAWDKIGAPIWQWIKDYAGQQWELIKSLASWVWSLGEPLRTLGKDAWTWLQNKLGIGEGPEGENGVLQWLQLKFDLAWGRIKATLEPFSTHLGVVRSALAGVAQTVTGPISQLGTLAAQVGKGVSWLASNLGKGKSIAEQHGFVEKMLIPPLIDGLRRAGGAVMSLAGSMTGALGKVASGLDNAAAALANSALSFVASAVQWVAGEARALADWATDKLQGVATWLQKAIGQFEQFLHGLAEFLSKVGGVVANVWSLPMLLAGRIWNAIPACIRDPVVDFVVPIILRQIELFADLARDSETWQKTKAQIMGIVRRVFVDHDLVGAVKASFSFVLRVLNIPEDMLGKVAAKAMAAWDIVSKAPLDFIKNTVRSLGHGFKLLWTNIGTHLEHGIEGWLFGELVDKDIHPPQSWTDPKAIFGFVLDVLGLKMSHVADLLKKRIDPKLVDKVQSWVGKFSRAWDWITSVIDTSKSAAENTQGLMSKAKDFGKSILTGAVEWIVGKVATELATLAAAAGASGGLSEVIDLARRMYKAILTAKRWAGRILQMASDTLDRALDIASGNITKVGGEFENLMDKGMPVVIGFLADQVGLGGIGAALRDIIDKLREKIDDAILWLIDKVKGGIEGLLSSIKAGIASITDWWKQKATFNAKDGTPHSLYFLGEDPAGELTLASSPMPVFAFLDTALGLINADQSLAPLLQHHARALTLAQRVNVVKTELQKPENARDPDKVAALNRNMNRLADAIQPLIDALYPDTKKGSGLRVGGSIRLLKVFDQIAKVEAFEVLEGLEMVRYTIYNPRAESWGSGGSAPEHGPSGQGRFARAQEGKDFEVWTGQVRFEYLDRNPGRDTPEGRNLYLKVAKKMQQQNKLRFEDVREDLDSAIVLYGGAEFTLDQCDLSHIVDAQAWWNANGRVTEPRSPIVQAFMWDPNNYELEPSGPNRSRGGSLSGKQTRYRPPVR